MPSIQIGPYRYSDRAIVRMVDGALYTGVDTSDGRVVYILHENEAQNGNAADVPVQVQHPALLTPSEVVPAEDGRYHVIKSPPGHLLHQELALLRQGKVWGYYQLLSALVQVCDAVDALHQADLVHGNIHPWMVLVQPGTTTQGYLLCFKPYQPQPIGRYLQAPATLPYVAPEQLRATGGRSSDIYAVGALLYTGFSAIPAFPTDESPYRLAEKIVWGDFEAFAPHFGGISPDILQAIAADVEGISTIAGRAVRRSAAARYETAQEIRQALSHIANRLAPVPLARRFFHENEFELARGLLVDEVARGQADWEIYMLLGIVYGDTDYDKAVEAFQQALRLNPQHISIRLNLADLYMQHGDYDRAKQEFGTIFRQHPQDIDVLFRFGRLLERSGNVTGALNVMAKIQTLNPYYLGAYIYAIELSMEHDDLAGAEATCRTALEHVSRVIGRGNLNRFEVAQLYFQRGLLHYKKKRPDHAIRWLNKVLTVVDSHAATHNLLAILYAQTGNMQKAITHLLTSLNSDPVQGGIMELISDIFSAQPPQTEAP